MEAKRLRHVIFGLTRLEPGSDVPLDEHEEIGGISAKSPDGHGSADAAQNAPGNGQLELLIEVYAQALIQMRSSFRLSLIFSALGASILLGGIAHAIWRAGSGGDQTATIVATVAGVVINMTAGLFFVQSNRARHHLEYQAARLRDDVREDERLAMAQQIIAEVSDDTVRDEVRVEVVRQLTLGMRGREDIRRLDRAVRQEGMSG